MFLPVQPGQCSKGARGTVLSQDTGGTMRDHSRPCGNHSLAEGGLWALHSPSKGGQQETGQPISSVLSSRAKTEGLGQQLAALDEKPGVPACSSVTLTPSCLGSAQPWLLEKDPGTLAWQTPAWGAPVRQVTSLDTSNLCSHCRRKTDLGRKRSRQAGITWQGQPLHHPGFRCCSPAPAQKGPWPAGSESLHPLGCSAHSGGRCPH